MESTEVRPAVRQKFWIHIEISATSTKRLSYTPKILGASSEYPAPVQLNLNTVNFLSFVIQQDVHLLGIIREAEGVTFSRT